MKKVKKISFPFSPQLKILANALLKDGDELRIVGGCVRDFLANQQIYDIDLACKYSPEKTISLLQLQNIKTVASGIKYGTITAIIDNQSFQITTLRKDVEHFGRSVEVEFIDDFYEDAARRDFTINAMSIDFSGNLYDYFGGFDDLQKGIVRFIGFAETRVKEDYLRILRFFRFSCRYSSNIDNQGLQAIIKYKDNLSDLSIERIKDEFFKILICKNRDNLMRILQIMQNNQILDFVGFNWSNLNYLKNLFILEKTLKKGFDALIILAILSPNVDFKFSNAEKKYLQLVSEALFVVDFQASQKDLLKLLLNFDTKTIIDIFTIQLVLSSNFENLIDDFIRISKIVQTSKVPDFPINGHDLIALNIKPEQIGKFLEIAKNYWWEHNFSPSKQQISSFLQKINNND